MSRSSFSTVEKLTIINLIRNEHYSINEVASMYNLNWSTIRSWIHKFETLGEAGLEEAKSNTSYSKEFKLNSRCIDKGLMESFRGTLKCEPFAEWCKKCDISPA